MMYENKFAVALKTASGKVLREFDRDKVYLPFGAEYSVFLKNMHDRRAVAQVTIDGQDVGDGMTFVIPAYGDMNIERFIKNGNLNEGNRFKFIEQTAAVAAHRGTDIEDGLVRVTFQLEKRNPIYRSYYDSGFDPFYQYGGTIKPRSADRTRLFTSSNTTVNASLRNSAEGFVYDTYSVVNTANEAGVTAPGSYSDQHFRVSDNFPLESEKTVIVLQILGETEDNRHVREPVTVKHKPKCVSCGHVNRFGAKFCTECGTALQVF